MYPFQNILFPTDFSPHSRVALKYAVAFARSGHGRVVVLNVQPSKVPADLLTQPEASFTSADSQLLNELRISAKDILRDPVLANVDVETLFADGEPAEEISRVAVDHDVDLVTLVTRGRKGLSRAFGVSIAEEIVAESPCAVLAVRPAQRDFVIPENDHLRLELKRIILATNFRPSSVAATLLARQISNHMGAELHVVYVIGDYFEQLSAMFPEGGLAALRRLRSYIEDRLSQFAR